MAGPAGQIQGHNMGPWGPIIGPNMMVDPSMMMVAYNQVMIIRKDDGIMITLE